MVNEQPAAAGPTVESAVEPEGRDAAAVALAPPSDPLIPRAEALAAGTGPRRGERS